MKKNFDLMFFKPNRVWRCYKGGKLLNRLMGEESGEDSLFPENWLGSITLASNGEHQQSEIEGLSVLTDGELFFEILQKNSMELLGESHGNLGVLCKFLDSAVRLPVQCHPDKEFAAKYCNSSYGKTESWFILDTREVNGEKPYILFGFREGVIKEQFSKAVAEQNIATMTSMMHKIEVKKGDAFFIPGKLPHAIGSGVLMLEVQEPTDLVIQPEEKIGDITLSFHDMWGDLTPELGLDCFDYHGYSQAGLLDKLAIKGKKIDTAMYSLIDDSLTDCFKVNKLEIAPENNYIFFNTKWHLAVVTSGHGTVKSNGKIYQLKHGDCFFIPCTHKELEFISTNDSIEIYLITT